MPSLREHALAIAARIVDLDGTGPLLPADVGVAPSVLARVAYSRELTEVLREELTRLDWRYPFPYVLTHPTRLVIPKGRPCAGGCGRRGPPWETDWRGWMRTRFKKRLLCPECYAREGLE